MLSQSLAVKGEENQGLSTLDGLCSAAHEVMIGDGSSPLVLKTGGVVQRKGFRE